MSCFPTTLPLLRHYQPDLTALIRVVMRTRGSCAVNRRFCVFSPFTVVNIKNVRMRILVVDDDRAVRESLRRLAQLQRVHRRHRRRRTRSAGEDRRRPA